MLQYTFMGLAHTLYRHESTKDTLDVFKFIGHVFESTYENSGLVRIAALRCVLYSVTHANHHNRDIMGKSFLLLNNEEPNVTS